MNKTTKNIYYVNEEIPESCQFTGETLFKDYAEKWLENNEKGLTAKTFNRYNSLLERINMGIGHISIGKLDTYHLTTFYKKLSLNGVNQRTGGGLSDRTILHHHRLIAVILRNAVRERIISYSVADKDHMKQPRAEQKEVRYLNEDETRRIVKLLNREEPKWRVATLLLLTTGVRRGELMGLEWQDIDFKNMTINISRASQYIQQKGIVTTALKTKKSKRVFKISENEVRILNEYHEKWLEERVGRSSRLFLQKNGKPMHPDSLTDWLNKFCEKHEIKHFSPHSLRHTHISLSIAMGISIREVAERVGHSRTSTTTDIYSHSIKSAEARASKAVGDLILEFL